MSKGRLVIAIAAVACLSSAAIAGDHKGHGGKGFAKPSGYNWSGVYMGVHGGYGWGESDITERPLQLEFDGFDIIPASFGSSHDVDGGLGGVHLGMNKQFGRWVIGGEVRLSGGDISGSTSDCGGLTSLVGQIDLDFLDAEFNCDTRVNWVAAALARLGYAHNRLLVYGTLGWAVAGVDHRSSINIDFFDGDFVVNLPSAENDTADGLAYGAGFEYAFSDSVSLGVEYTRMNLESEGSGLFLGGILTSGSRDIDLNTVTGRLNIKWGG